jgi:hypothetical protein
MVQQYNVGLHPSPRRRVEEVGEEPRVEEGILGAQMGMVEYHVIVGGGGVVYSIADGWSCHYRCRR